MEADKGGNGEGKRRWKQHVVAGGGLERVGECQRARATMGAGLLRVYIGGIHVCEFLKEIDV